MTRLGTVFTPALVAVIVALIGSAAALSAIIRANEFRLTKLPIQSADGLYFHTLPPEFPCWRRGRPDREVSKEEALELGTDNSLSRLYVETCAPEGEDPHAVDVHIAYYTGMIDTVPHVPERCLVAAGVLRTGESRLVDVPLDFSRLVPDPRVDPELLGGPVYRARSTTVHRRFRLPAGADNLRLRVTPFVDHRGRAFYAGYFFIANGGTVPSADDIRLLAFNLKDDYAYYAKVQFTSSTVESAEELGVVAGRMLDEMFADIMHRLPDWVEVKEGRYPTEAAPE